MIKIFKASLIFFFYFSFLNAEVVKKIEISGNKRISEETIKVYGDIELNKDYQKIDLNQITNNLFSTEFFENVTIDLIDNTLKIEVKEHPIVNQLIFVGEKNKRIIDQIKKIIKLNQKRPFIESYLSKDVAMIRKLYSSIGYNFVKIEPKIRKIDDTNIDLIIELDKGNQTLISSINFIGDKKIRDNKLRDIIASEEDKFYKVLSKNTKFSEELIKLDIRLLTNYYRSNGYYNVEITSNSAELNKDGNVNLIYSINAGEKFIINKIETNADPVFDQEIFFDLNKTYNKYIGEYYSPFYIKEMLEDIDSLIEKKNLQFVEHNVEEILDENSILIRFNIFESDKTIIERINVRGNSVTNENVIRGELLVDEGDPLTKISVDKSVSKLKSRNIFRDVNYKVEDGSQDTLKVVNIDIEEKPTGEVSAGAGVGTNGGTFAINVTENNWLGKGKRVNFEIEVDEESLEGTLNFNDPNYNFLGNSLNYSISSESNDKPDQGYENSVFSAGIATSFEQYKNIFASLGLNASYDDLRTDGSASSSLKKQAGEFSELTGTYGFKYDGRNRTFSPTKGYVLNFAQDLPIYADKMSISNRFSTSLYKSLSDDVVVASKVYLTTITGLNDDDVRISKRKNLSSSRLRGFQRGRVGPKDGTDHIGGNYAAALNFEANLPNLLPESARTEVGLFLDFGNVWGVDYDDTIDESNKIRSSTGISASWNSPLGPMTFVFSTDLSKADTDETEGFNFNLGTTF